jgi:4'-phosphopantetheinyl transferase
VAHHPLRLTPVTPSDHRNRAVGSGTETVLGCPERVAVRLEPVPSVGVRSVLRWGIPTGPPDDGFLTEGERRRADAHRSAAAREAFVARRWFAREVVAEATGCAPPEVHIAQRCPRCDGPHGRPTVSVPHGPRPFASWSSAGDVTVVAVGRQPVGVDVVARPELLVWARLEAVLKATGHGLDVDPSLVELSATGVQRWDGPGPRPRLRITDVTFVDGLIGAVARGRRRQVRAVAAGRRRTARA